MRKYLIVITIVLVLFSLAACGDQKATGSVVSSSEEVKEDKDAPYVEGNKNIMRRENEEMQMFIRRYGWKMQRTPTGLYVEVLESGDGELFKENDRVAMAYKTFLLSEAAQMLRPGAKARLVIPSYLAYGVAGDGDRIQGLQPIVMEVRVLEKDEKLPENYIPKPYSVSK